MSFSLSPIRRFAISRDLRLAGGIAGFLAGVTMVVMSVGDLLVTESTVTAMLELAALDAAQAAPYHHRPTDTCSLTGDAELWCTPSVQTRMQFTAAPAAAVQDATWQLPPGGHTQATQETPVISISSKPLDARDWLYIRGMAAARHT